MKIYNIIFRLLVIVTAALIIASLALLIYQWYKISNDPSFSTIASYRTVVGNWKLAFNLYRVGIIGTVVVAVLSIIGFKITGVVSTTFRDLFTTVIAVLGVMQFKMVSDICAALEIFSGEFQVYNLFHFGGLEMYTEEDAQILAGVWVVSCFIYLILCLTSFVSMAIGPKKPKVVNQNQVMYGQQMYGQQGYAQPQVYINQPGSVQQPYAYQPNNNQNQQY